MTEAVDVETLALNICNVYQHYKKLFKNEYTYEVFKHYKFKQDRPKYSSELIIESGFKIYAILRKYIEIYK